MLLCTVKVGFVCYIYTRGGIAALFSSYYAHTVQAILEAYSGAKYYWYIHESFPKSLGR